MFSAAATCVIMMQVTGQRRAGGNHGGRRMHRVGTWLLAPVFAARQQRAVTCAGEGKARGEAGKWGCDHGGSSSHSSACGCGWWWCVLQLFRAPRGRIQPLSQMGQDLQAHDRKWLEGLPRRQGTRSLETITETISFRNGNRTRALWKSTRVLLPSLAVSRRAEDVLGTHQTRRRCPLLLERGGLSASLPVILWFPSVPLLPLFPTSASSGGSL